MQAIGVKGTSRRAVSASDWFLLAMMVAMIGLALGSLLVATAAAGGRDRSHEAPPAYSQASRITHGNLPGDEGAAGPASDTLPTHGQLP